MLECKKNKIWIEHISNLFCSANIVPLDGMSLAEQMNSLSRLVIIIFIILLIIDFRFSGLFLLLSLIFIIILYYIQKNSMERFGAENYTHLRNIGVNNMFNTPLISMSNSEKFYDDETPLDGIGGAFNNPKWESKNQMLAGPANPKTKIAPVIVPPIADLSYWRGTNLVTYPQINSQGNTDLHRSGYLISDDIEIKEKYTGKDRNRHDGSKINTKYQDYKSTGTYKTFPSGDGFGDVETSWGYNSDQLMIAGLPSNLSAAGMSREPEMKRYNENLFTQTIQPGVYTRSEIVEPINSNIGISFTQQFPPASDRIDPRTGALLRTEYDPRTIEPVWIKENAFRTANESDIYDPRFTGYGTSYRSYNDDVCGQPRFYYDDVNAIRMPNYISRSNIDNQPFADQYGPLPTGFENGNPRTCDIREMAENAFLQGSLQHRTELSERLMRKVNSEQWQRRAAPINKSSGRMMGGYGGI
jgi:hypothetical protein